MFPRLFSVNGNKVKRKVVPVGVRMERAPAQSVREVPVAAPAPAPKAAAAPAPAPKAAPANLRTRSQYRAAGVRL